VDGSGEEQRLDGAVGDVDEGERGIIGGSSEDIWGENGAEREGFLYFWRVGVCVRIGGKGLDTLRFPIITTVAKKPRKVPGFS
jgi:hypothetical protein